MERSGAFRELVQEEKRKLTNEEIFESAFYQEMLLSVAGELTGGTLKKVELVKLPESGWAGKCNDRRVLLNIENGVTASFPSVALKSDSITGILGHECGHWNFSDFGLREKYLKGIRKGEWYLHPPKPETISEAEHLEEINGYLEQKHGAVLALLAETASFLQNMLEDVYVEQKMCERYPGSIRRGIRQNRVRNVERIPSLKVQLESGYKPAAVLLNLMAQYSLTGTVNNWENMTGGILEFLDLVKPVIDAAVTSESAGIRMDAANRILLIIWKILLEEIQEMEKEPQELKKEGSQNQPEEDSRRESNGQCQSEELQNGTEKEKGPEGPESQSKELQNAQEEEGEPGEPESQSEESQNSQEKEGQLGERQNQQEEMSNPQEGECQLGENGKKSRQNLQEKAKEQQKEQEEPQQNHAEEIQRMLSQLRVQLPEFLLEKDGEDVEGNLKRKGEISKVNRLLPKEQKVETRDMLMEYIQGVAEEHVEKEQEERYCLELSRELLETEFDGDHRKAKKVLVRETVFPEETLSGYLLHEEKVRDIMRRMKPRLLPVLSCQSPHMERNLFFGSQMDYQALYNPEKRIFRNLEIRKKVNTAVALLIDMSGSMENDNRMEQARLCALCLYELCRSVGIPILVYGHHTDKKYKRIQDETVYLHSLAEFDADYNDKYRIAGMREGGCNRDGAAIIFVGEKLAKRPEKLKLLFLVSDGFPNATFYCGEKAEADLRQIKEKLEKKRITMLTAAIGEDKEAIERIYKEGFLDISDLEQLPYILPKQILKYIRR